MRKRHALLVMVVVLALALASCGRPAAEPAEPGPSASEQEATVEATATPVPETEDEAPTADTEEAEPTEEASQEVEEGDTEEEEEENAFAEVADVGILDSYRQTITVRTQEGDDEMEEMTYTVKSVREPPARHTVMSAEEEGESRQITEIIQIGNMQYMRMASDEGEGDGDWMMITGDEELTAEEVMEDMIPTADAFMKEKACEMMGTEKVSGLETRHYYCDLNVLEGEISSFSTAEADIWVSTEYNLPIKVHATYTQKGSDDQEGTAWETEQVIDMINEPMDIQPPEGLSETGLPDDIPLMESATGLSTMGNIVVFETPETVEKVTEYYKEAMAKEGWTEDEDQAMMPGSFGFTKDDRAVSFMVGDEDGQTSVMITLQE